MKTYAQVTILLILSTFFFRDIQAQERYKTYQNVRFEFCLDVPYQIFEAQRPPENGDGLRFLSRYGESLLITHGGHSLGKSLKQEMEFELETGDFRDRKREITYERIAEDFFILSGYVGEKIFYQRTHLENKIFKSLYLEYPKAEKERFNEIISHMVKNFPNCSSN
ncbi:MAG: hypothetical protein AAFY45_27820 [Bacteroidota bacterium]